MRCHFAVVDFVVRLRTDEVGAQAEFSSTGFFADNEHSVINGLPAAPGGMTDINGYAAGCGPSNAF